MFGLKLDIATVAMSWQGSNWKSWGWGHGTWPGNSDGDRVPPSTTDTAGAAEAPPPTPGADEAPLPSPDAATAAADDASSPTSDAVVLMIGLKILHHMLGAVETFSVFAARLMNLSSASGSSGPSSDQLLVELARDLGAN